MTTVDVLVVGGGPSGLSAAAAAAEGGASVLLVDEWPELGGRLRYRRASVHLGDAGPLPPSVLRDRLVERAGDAGVALRPATVAWAAFAGSGGLEVGIRGADGSDVVRPSRLVLATGTTDRAPALPGATLPGVLTARALQILLHVHGVRPGRRFVILGDDRADELAGDIEAAGGTVVAAVTSNDVSTVTIHGTDGVHRVDAAGRTYDVDIVVTALGTLPDAQLAGMLGCELEWTGAWSPRPRRGVDGSLSVAGVFACGGAAGADSIGPALLDGARVGVGRARDVCGGLGDVVDASGSIQV